jgi:SAM-dependent methyltransferase
LDISGNALDRSRARLGKAGRSIHWIESDVVDFQPLRRYALWHDRAVFHFLTESADRDRYIDVLCKSLVPKGHFVLATFGPQGPKRCSGLDIRRYGIEQLREIFGGRFELHDHEIDKHETPMGSKQQFLYSRWHSLL